MKRFYYAADWGFGRYATVENVLVSAGSMYHLKSDKLRLAKGMIPSSTKRLFIDSGGFSFFTRWGDYPFDIERYVELIRKASELYPVTEVATMDYPCEPNVIRDTYENNRDRIDATVSNATLCIDYDKSIPWVPVIQGYTIEEYVYCINQYQEAGITNQLWAIGSLCARKKIGGIKSIILKIRDIIDDDIHTFGMTYKAIKDPQIYFAIYSTDSGAWSFKDKAYQKPASLRRYMRKIDSLIEGYQGQTMLEEY